ncbi:hypothetical protein BH09VER1_BH09VER1_22590 [soil metagenome]
MTGEAPITEAEARLRKRAAAWIGSEDFREVARTEGLDFATAVLYEDVMREPENARFCQSVCGQTTEGELSVDLIGVVPGAFYRTHRKTGADGARVLSIASQLGCEAELIPVESFGRLEDNAAVILKWIESHPGRRIALISLSKGSADVKCALGIAPGALANVTSWVSFSGMVQGTPLVEWLRVRVLRWWAVRFLLWGGGHDGAALEQMSHGRQTQLDSWPAWPAHLRAVHVYGFPLREHLHHRWAPRGYRRLAPLGPNDGGGILLEDVLRLPGIVCPIWGADHYLDPSWGATGLLQNIVARALSLPRQASQ